MIERRAEGDKALDDVAKQLAEATDMGGDTEILDALFVKARLLSKFGDWTEATTVYDEILSKPKTSMGKKIDANLEKARIALFNTDIPKIKELITEARKLIDLGGDWDRRNRLKVYEALSFLVTREFRQASVLFQECIATFTCIELCSYNQFMFYTVVSSVFSLSRTELHKKLISNPQVIAVIREMPDLQNFLHSIYNCEYAEFFRALLANHPSIVADRFVGPHTAYLVREYRVLAYAQFLEAYRSVRMSSMAQSFGVSLGLLDEELSRFIAAGRLNAKIDKVGDIIETSRPDVKNAQYQETIKKGDSLLNQIQRLVRVVDV